MWGDNFYQELGLYIHSTHDWQWKKFRQLTMGKGDIIYNSLRRIIDDKDTSDWAFRALWICKELLLDGKRWPDWMNHERDAKNRIGWWWSRLLYNLYLINHQKYRPQTSMTRDPWCYFYTASVILERKRFVEIVPIPWWLWRQPVWAWRRYLIEPTERNKRRWLFWESLNCPKKEYAKRMVEYRAMAAKKIKQ